MRFAEVAQEAFSFLEAKGFGLVQRDPQRLRYESDQSVVVIEWDPRSGEIDVFVGLRPEKGEPQDVFSLSDLLKMQGADAPERTMPFQIADENRLAPFIEKLAQDTRVHAQSALASDRMFFRRLKTFRSAQSQAQMRQMELHRVRSGRGVAQARTRQIDQLVFLNRERSE